MKHVEFNINGFVSDDAKFLVEYLDHHGILEVGEHTITMIVTEE